MKKGTLLASVLGVATVGFVVLGTIFPGPTAIHYAGGQRLMQTASSPQAAVQKLADQIRAQDWSDAYASLGNKAQFTQQQFIHDLTGHYLSLRTYATLQSFDVRSLHASDDQADMQLHMVWSSVVGTFTTMRTLHVVKDGDLWHADWPLVKEPVVPPQVIAVNYLRWDVIYRGAGDDWGTQDVEAPHVRIVDMHPIQRAAGVFVMGELLNEDVVPAYVSVRAVLISKTGATIANEGSFDKISPILLPKQVTPFLIEFPNVDISTVGSIRMIPLSTLVSASADPVIEIENQQLHPVPAPSLTGQLVNQSGQIVNIAHVLATFYDKSGQLVWVADSYSNRALLPQTPVPFQIKIPEDLAHKISSQRTIVATYSAGGFR